MKYQRYRVKLYLAVILSLMIVVPTYADSQNLVYLEQNWTDKDREYFYFADQGSRLITYDYFINLEQAKNDQLLRSDESMLRFGFIPTEKSSNNPDGLPIGLARNGNQMGPTCAACHTQQITYKDQMIRIDGGQGFIDLQRFLTALRLSLKATLEDKEKFVRFQKRLYGKFVSKQQQTVLKQTLQVEYEKRVRYDEHNYSDIAFGYGRTAAFDVILNTALVETGEKNNTHPLTGFTNFPYIWDTPQHDYVEWNGSQSNTGVGALSRNIGVLSVFLAILKPNQPSG